MSARKELNLLRTLKNPRVFLNRTSPGGEQFRITGLCFNHNPHLASRATAKAMRNLGDAWEKPKGKMSAWILPWD